MLRTKAQLRKALKGITEGKIIIYPSVSKDYVLINLTASVIEWLDKDLVNQLIQEGIIFPFNAFTLDRERLQEKGGARAS